MSEASLGYVLHIVTLWGRERETEQEDAST